MMHDIELWSQKQISNRNNARKGRVRAKVCGLMTDTRRTERELDPVVGVYDGWRVVTPASRARFDRRVVTWPLLSHEGVAPRSHPT